MKAEVGSGKKRSKVMLFSKFTMTIQINSYLTILMCFGALFPPLAIIAAISIYSITYFEELWIGWLLQESRKRSSEGERSRSGREGKEEGEREEIEEGEREIGLILISLIINLLEP